MESYFYTFTKLVEDQFKYGGKKYAHSNEKESTDCLFDAHGKNWLFGTIDKYCYRFKNLARERDLLKIACYMYILWLKRGFFFNKEGVNDPPINTTVDIKEKYFSDFIKLLETKYNKCKLFYQEKETNISKIEFISFILKQFSKTEWKDLDQSAFITVFFGAYFLWETNFRDTAGSDTDTWLEEKKKEN